MGRHKKNNIDITSYTSLTGLMQETYNDACSQIDDVQRTINELVVSTSPETVEEYALISKEKGNLLKVKDSAIKVKLEIAKLQADILKKNSDVDTKSNVVNANVTTDDFKKIREMLKKSNIDDNDF